MTQSPAFSAARMRAWSRPAWRPDGATCLRCLRRAPARLRAPAPFNPPPTADEDVPPGEPLVVVAAYDALFARLSDEAGVPQPLAKTAEITYDATRVTPRGQGDAVTVVSISQTAPTVETESSAGVPRRVTGEMVTANYFQLLRAPLSAGRTFQPGGASILRPRHRPATMRTLRRRPCELVDALELLGREPSARRVSRRSG